MYHDLVALRALMIVLAACAFPLVVGLGKLVERCARKLASLRAAKAAFFSYCASTAKRVSLVVSRATVVGIVESSDS